MNKQWSDNEVKVLYKFYPQEGGLIIKRLPDRTITAIRYKARKLKIKNINRKSSWKPIIQKLESNKIIAKCKHHGITVYYHNQHNRRSRCVKCNSNQFQKWSKRPSSKIKIRNAARARLTKPINIYKNRLRGTLYYCFKGTKGFTKNLPYSSQELYNHIEKIKLKQNNQCPMCKDNYDNTGFDIDHIIPLSSTSNESKLLALFNLENLSLLCPRCNRYVKRDRLPPI